MQKMNAARHAVKRPPSKWKDSCKRKNEHSDWQTYHELRRQYDHANANSWPSWAIPSDGQGEAPNIEKGLEGKAEAQGLWGFLEGLSFNINST